MLKLTTTILSEMKEDRDDVRPELLATAISRLGRMESVDIMPDDSEMYEYLARRVALHQAARGIPPLTSQK